MRYDYFITTFIFALSSFLHLTTALGDDLALVGNKTITLESFKQKYSTVKEQTNNPPSPKAFLEDLIRYEVGLQEARKKKFEKDPQVKQQMDEALYRGFVEKSLREPIKKIKKITEKDMKAYYKRNPEVRTSHILIEVPPDASKKQIAESKKRAEAIYAKVKKSKRPFEELVKLYTDDSLSKNNSATTPGDLGYQSRVTLVPTYYNAAIKMKKNKIKGLVRSRYGFHIIKLTGVRSYADANKQQIRAAVFDTKRRMAFDQFFSKLKKNYKITINKSILTTVK